MGLSDFKEGVRNLLGVPGTHVAVPREWLKSLKYDLEHGLVDFAQEVHESQRVTQKQVHDLAVEKGWWDPKKVSLPSSIEPSSFAEVQRDVPELLALVHSEVSEALEAWRESEVDFTQSWWRHDPASDGEFAFKDTISGREFNKPVGFWSELADIVIRVMDIAEHFGIDLDDAIAQKHAYNKTRPHRHGGKKA